jgi:uncharacterized phiE125 gp8 family phage protein
VNLLYGDWSECVHGTRALITAPTDAVLTRPVVKQHLRIDFDDDDDLIDALILAVVAQIDPAAGGWLGRALRPQTWELRLHGFPNRGIQLPFPPLISVSSLKYDDTNGVEQTLVENTGFRVLGIGTNGKQVVAPLYNQIWPNARCDSESVRIRFRCGYPVAIAADPNHVPPIEAVPDALPPPIIAWMKLIIGSLYENRESVVIGTREIVAQLPDHILQMISPYRVYG